MNKAILNFDNFIKGCFFILKSLSHNTLKIIFGKKVQDFYTLSFKILGLVSKSKVNTYLF